MIDIGLKWSKGPEYILDKEGSVAVIRQVGRYTADSPDREFEPLKHFSDLAFRLAELKTSDDYLRFAKSYGLLETKERHGAAEKVEGWRRAVQNMNGLISVFGAKDAVPGGILRMKQGSIPTHFEVTEIKVTLVPSVAPGDRPPMILQTKTLLSAIHLQFANAIASGHSIRKCAECSKLFYVGLGDDVRRSDATFCSKPCNNKFQYRQRRGK